MRIIVNSLSATFTNHDTTPQTLIDTPPYKIRKIRCAPVLFHNWHQKALYFLRKTYISSQDRRLARLGLMNPATKSANIFQYPRVVSNMCASAQWRYTLKICYIDDVISCWRNDCLCTMHCVVVYPIAYHSMHVMYTISLHTFVGSCLATKILLAIYWLWEVGGSS